jgi:phthalate 4,5-dioxygenase oxygenase subunit
MLNREENEIIVHTGPGTPMGEVMRRYWLPALLSWELEEPDCTPVRVKLVGEELIAFKDTDGNIGLVDNYCPHRRASLFFGRNEECGLRCVYHGWKFDVNGNCVDMPSEPAESNFKDKVKITSYPCLDMGGVIWTYMGPPDKQPPPPKFEWTQVPDTHRGVTKVKQEGNWSQALEGGIDSIHATYLHNNDITNAARYEQRATVAHIEVEPTDYGYTYGSVRPVPDLDGNFVRAYHYVMPFTQLRPNQNTVGRGDSPPMVAGHMWVPMDDDNCMVYNWTYTLAPEPLSDELRSKHGPEVYKYIDVENGFRCIWNRDNDYGIDREVQRTKTYTGIESAANLQDRAIQESMGIQYDRSHEHLATTDRAIISARRMLLEAAKIVEDGGSPPGVAGTYYGIRAIERVLPENVRWQDALHEALFEGEGYSPAV